MNFDSDLTVKEGSSIYFDDAGYQDMIYQPINQKELQKALKEGAYETLLGSEYQKAESFKSATNRDETMGDLSQTSPLRMDFSRKRTGSLVNKN